MRERSSFLRLFLLLRLSPPGAKLLQSIMAIFHAQASDCSPQNSCLACHLSVISWPFVVLFYFWTEPSEDSSSDVKYDRFSDFNLECMWRAHETYMGGLTTHIFESGIKHSWEILCDVYCFWCGDFLLLRSSCILVTDKILINIILIQYITDILDVLLEVHVQSH